MRRPLPRVLPGGGCSRAGGGITDDPGNRIACTATFLDASNAVLGSLTNSPGTAPANKSLGWLIVELAGAVPAGTRRVRVRFDLVRTNAGITNLFVDDREPWFFEGAPPAAPAGRRPACSRCPE